MFSPQQTPADATPKLRLQEAQRIREDQGAEAEAAFLGRVADTFTISTGETHLTNAYPPTQVSKKELVQRFTRHQVGQKEGSCTSPLVFADGKRGKDNAMFCELAVFDLDKGQPFKQIRSNIEAAGAAAALASTFNHLTTETSVSEKDLDRIPHSDAADWMEQNGYVASVFEAARFVLEGGRLKRLKLNKSVRFLIDHAPCEKYRAALFATWSWLAEHYASQEGAIEAYTAGLKAGASRLGLNVDFNAMDGARAFFNPRTSGSRPLVVDLIGGGTIDIWPDRDAPTALKLQPALKSDAVSEVCPPAVLSSKGSQIAAQRHEVGDESVEAHPHESNSAEQREDVRASLSAIAKALGGDESGSGVLCPGPDHSPKDRSLSVSFGFKYSEGFRVHSFAQDTERACRDHVKALLTGLEHHLNVLARAPVVERDDAGRTAYAIQIWERAKPLRGTPAEAYLEGRGLIVGGAVTALRFHPEVPFRNETAPAMLAAMTDAASGEFTGIHRTRLNPKFKAMLGRAKGAVVRLTDDVDLSDGLAVCEGIETGLALLQKGVRPIWSALSAEFLAKLPVLSDVPLLTIFADHDENGVGERAAQLCAERWEAASRKVRIVMPPEPGTDFADLVAREVTP